MPDNAHPEGAASRSAAVDGGRLRWAGRASAALTRPWRTHRRWLTECLPAWAAERRRARAAVAVRLTLSAALVASVLVLAIEDEVGRPWLGLATLALLLTELERWLLRQRDLPWRDVVRAAVRVLLVIFATLAAAVAAPVYWWVPIVLTLLVLQAALCCRGRIVVPATAVAALANLAASWHWGGPGGEAGPTEVAVAVTVGLPTVAWLVHTRSSRARRERADLQRAMRDLRVASVEMQRSQEVLRRWNEDLRGEVDRQTGALEERNRYLSIINAVSFALAEPMDDERALERAVRLVARLLGVRAAQAYTEPRPGHPIALFVPVAAEDVHAPRVPEALLRVVASTGRPLSSFDISPAASVLTVLTGPTGPTVPTLSAPCAGGLIPEHVVEEFLGGQPLPDLGEAYHVVPLVAKGRVLGSFALVGTGGLRHDDDGRHLLLLVGREMGIAIENARLYQEAIEKAEREAFLTEVSHLLNGPGRGDRALPAVLEALRSHTAADEVMLVTVPEDSRDVVVAGLATRAGIRGHLERLARALPQQVADRSRPLILGVGGEAPLSDRLVVDGVTTLAVAPIYLQRGEAFDEPPQPSAPGRTGVTGAPRSGAPHAMLTGALVIALGSEGEWTDDDAALLERVSEIIARRVQADEFVAVQQQRIRELTGLAEVARLMQSGAEDERLYHGFASALRRLTRYEALHIARLDDGVTLTGVPSFGATGRPAGASFTDDDVSHPWFALRSPLLWAQGDSPVPTFVSDEVRHAIVVPMRPKGQMLGIVVVAVPRPLRGGQIAIVEQAVEQLSLALDGATLYQQAAARASHIQALSNLARIAASVMNLREAFAAFAEEVRWLIPFDRAVMFLVDEDEGSVEPYACYPDGMLAANATALAGSIAGAVAAAGSATAIRRDDPRHAALDWEALGHGVAEVAAVPIRRGGRTTAIFALLTNSTEAYAIGDLDALDEVAGLLAVTIERQRLFEHAEHNAKHDLLTGLPNYRYLQERLQSLRGVTPPAAALVVDMDNLKVFNDTLGHGVGDGVIREVARVLREACREDDFVARTGGDEFVILMTDTDSAGALAVADRVHSLLREIHVVRDGIETRVGVSIGVALWPGDADSPASLLHLADQAMYEAKFAGGQRTRLASERTRSRESRAVRRRRVHLADTLIRTLTSGGSIEELASVSLAQRWASAAVERARLPAERLPEVRLAIAAGASRRFTEVQVDGDQLLARALVERMERDWEVLSECRVGEQLAFLVRAVLDLGWLTAVTPAAAGTPTERLLARIADTYPQAVDLPVWRALEGVVRDGAERRRAA